MVEPAQMYRRCVSCGVTETPLWRAGPAGPKTLCNACGVRWRKRKVAMEKTGEPGAGTGAVAGARQDVAAVRSSSGKMASSVPQRVRPIVDGAVAKKRAVPAKQQQHQQRLADAAKKQSMLKSISHGEAAVVLPTSRVLQNGDDRMDLSKIYFYSEDDDDGLPAIIEIEPVERELDAALLQDRERRSKLAHEQFSVLLHAARVIDLS